MYVCVYTVRVYIYVIGFKQSHLQHTQLEYVDTFHHQATAVHIN